MSAQTPLNEKTLHESNDVRYGEVAAAKASYTRSLGEIPQVHEPFGGDTGTPQHPSPAKPYRARANHPNTTPNATDRTHGGSSRKSVFRPAAIQITASCVSGS